RSHTPPPLSARAPTSVGGGHVQNLPPAGARRNMRSGSVSPLLAAAKATELAGDPRALEAFSRAAAAIQLTLDNVERPIPVPVPVSVVPPGNRSQAAGVGAGIKQLALGRDQEGEARGLGDHEPPEFSDTGGQAQGRTDDGEGPKLLAFTRAAAAIQLTL
ncbi:unnamed protein product, partial [Discosporangium mesarthrocarpum]